MLYCNIYVITYLGQYIACAQISVECIINNLFKLIIVENLKRFFVKVIVLRFYMFIAKNTYNLYTRIDRLFIMSTSSL